jgi:hypothetical protein
MRAKRSSGPFPLKTGAPKQFRLISPAACWLAAAKVDAEIERDGLRRSPYSKQWGAREDRRNRSRAPDRLPASHVRSDETGCRHNIIIEFFLSPAGITRGGEKRIATGKKSSSSASVVPRVPLLALRKRGDWASVTRRIAMTVNPIPHEARKEMGAAVGASKKSRLRGMIARVTQFGGIQSGRFIIDSPQSFHPGGISPWIGGIQGET